MKEALKTMIHMLIGAGYYFGDALEGYNALGYRLDPLVVRALAEYMLPPPPRPRFFPKNRWPYRFSGIATEQIPVLVGGKEDFRYAMEGIPEDFQGSVQEKLDIIQIALSQEKIKLPNAEEVLLCKIGTSLKEQKKRRS